ncbi:MAG: fasciclin domain-containing protein [Actinomycetota bacterium]
MRKLLCAVAVTGLLSSCSGSGESQVLESSVEAEIPGDVVSVASSTEGFTTLVAALDAAELVGTLQGDGPFTVLAPTDEAFAALQEGLLDKLLLPENKEVLLKILTYHIISGKVTSAEVVDGQVVSVEGTSLSFSTATGIQVNNAKVAIADVEAKNGIIHVIDKVLIPATVDISLL